jgi:hypothetical protein
MLPAGQYLVKDEGGVIQFSGERGTRAGMFVMTTPAPGHNPAGNSPALAFRRYENQYRLTDIWQSAMEGREVSHS